MIRLLAVFGILLAKIKCLINHAFYLSSTQPSIPYGCLTFPLIKSAFEFLDLLSVPFNESLRIDDFFLCCTELIIRHFVSSPGAYRDEILTWTFFTRCANKRVLVLSVTALGSGFTVQMTLIRASPESDGCSIRVSFEFRYGT